MGNFRALVASLLTFCIFASAVLGNPVQCNKQDQLLSVLLKPATKSAALSYCSSYIHVPKITKTVATVTKTIVVKSTSSTYPVSARAIDARATGSLSAFLHSFRPSRISSACSCLSPSITHATQKVTATSTLSLCPLPTSASLNPNGYCFGSVAYCVEGSNIILRCSGDKLQPGNCNDNLGEPINGTLCIDTGPLVGDAVCSAIGEPAPGFPIPTGGLATLC